jgi:ElaB/YqjD/DUF883 family membrane-anchored ribosome-binding protein
MASFSLDDAQSQIDQLRRQMNSLVGDHVTPTLNQAADRLQTTAKQAHSYTMDQADSVAEQVRDRPLVAIAVAAAVGYVLGRFVR